MTQNEYNKSVMDYADDVYRFVLKNIRHQEDAKDIVQQAFEVLWMKKEDVETDKVKSFLLTIAYRKMIDELRKKKRITLKDEIHERMGGTTETTQTDLKRTLNNALEMLPAIQKQLVLLKDYEGYSYEEIADITALNESQVKVYLFRARVSLKKTLVSVETNI